MAGLGDAAAPGACAGAQPCAGHGPQGGDGQAIQRRGLDGPRVGRSGGGQGLLEHRGHRLDRGRLRRRFRRCSLGGGQVPGEGDQAPGALAEDGQDSAGDRCGRDGGVLHRGESCGTDREALTPATDRQHHLCAQSGREVKRCGPPRSPLRPRACRCRGWPMPLMLMEPLKPAVEETRLPFHDGEPLVDDLLVAWPTPQHTKAPAGKPVGAS